MLAAATLICFSSTPWAFTKATTSGTSAASFRYASAMSGPLDLTVARQTTKSERILRVAEPVTVMRFSAWWMRNAETQARPSTIALATTAVPSRAATITRAEADILSTSAMRPG